MSATTVDPDALALVAQIVATPVDDRWYWAIDQLRTYPNADVWNLMVHLEWGDGMIIVDEYSEDERDPAVYRVGIYPADDDGCIGDVDEIVDTIDVLAAVALVNLLTELRPEWVDWAAWAAHYIREIWPDQPESRGGIYAAAYLVAH